MTCRSWMACVLIATLLAGAAEPRGAQGCACTFPTGFPVVNADQTVIILWDAATKTEHFIRQASFKSASADFGFLVPTPNRPELDESGNEAFPYLRQLTEPAHITKPRPMRMPSIGCSAAPTAAAPSPVTVVEEKRVAGFDAVVLKAESADALMKWLDDHKYAFSPEVKAWVAPYVEKGWHITAMQVAKDGTATAAEADNATADSSKVSAAALRMSFKTDYPLFPYREPDSAAAAEKLGSRHRLLRIYFLSDARYEGSLGPTNKWSGNAAWAGQLTAADRTTVLKHLKLPETTGPGQWWLTEFEDDWAYKPAPADLSFARSVDQSPLQREPIIHYTQQFELPRDVTLYAILTAVIVPPLVIRWRRRRR